MDREFLEAGIDFDRANAARMYDYMLGGAHNFAVDRDQVAKLLAAHPGVAEVARQNRAFLGRAVRWCAANGIDQFLDLGSGVPTVGNVHEIAQAERPDARVAYVDFEPVAVAHAGEITDGLDTVSVTRADLREARTVLSSPGVAGLLDLTRPVALLTVAVLHFVPEPPAPVLAPYLAALAPGSVLVLSHSSADHDDPETARLLAAAAAAYRDSATPVYQRDRAELRAVLDGLELVPPGLVDAADWPDVQGRTSGHYAAVARLP